jgi:ribosomal protein L7/L12
VMITRDTHEIIIRDIENMTLAEMEERIQSLRQRITEKTSTPVQTMTWSYLVYWKTTLEALAEYLKAMEENRTIQSEAEHASEMMRAFLKKKEERDG